MLKLILGKYEQYSIKINEYKTLIGLRNDCVLVSREFESGVVSSYV
tara:strand:+ start:203 stop:340 length:138 start_codon:yes stop_codon:yes gene_type:complete